MVLEKKEEVTALEMRLQALDKDLDWKKEVTGFFVIKVYTNTVEPVYDEPLYSVTSLLGYRYSSDTSIHGGTKFGPGECSDNLCICYGSMEGTPLFRERGTFSGSRNLDLTSIQGAP